MNAKKSTALRPRLESLESMVLLSAVVGGAHAAKTPVHVSKTPTYVAPVASGPVVLVGTLHGSGRLTSSTSATVGGSGNLGKVGTASFKLTADLINLPTSATLSTRRGKLFLVGDGPLVGGANSGSVHYSIKGGTGQYVNATGSGNVVGSYTVLKGNKISATLKFS